MIYGSVCSGIEAASVAWEPLGWEPEFFSEIDKFPSAVLAHHWPNVPNLGDMTKFKEWNIGRSIDLLVGGTPCQSFSVAGLRKGLDDPRGNLMLTYLAIAEQLSPRWLVWENVPGVLSSSGGKDFGTFLGALAKLGYGFAYRVFDAQYFGVAQRRRRVFVIGYTGDWRRAAAVLFERESLRRDTEPGREAGEEVAAITASGDGTSGAYDAWDSAERLTPGDVWPKEVASTLNASFGSKLGLENQHVNSGCPLFVPGRNNGLANALVRRLTPVEWERLQGFPDNHTRIPWRNKPEEECPDGPRYKAIGNSMAVPVMNWIGKRIQKVEELKLTC